MHKAFTITNEVSSILENKYSYKNFGNKLANKIKSSTSNVK